MQQQHLHGPKCTTIAKSAGDHVSHVILSNNESTDNELSFQHMILQRGAPSPPRLPGPPAGK